MNNPPPPRDMNCVTILCHDKPSMIYRPYLATIGTVLTWYSPIKCYNNGREYLRIIHNN
jgi:hypothetical protein